MRYTSISCMVFMWTQEGKKTNRESARIRPSGEANRICLSSLSLVVSYRKSKICSAEVVDFVDNPLNTTARPFIGTVRANPVAAPAAPIVDLPLDSMS